MRELSYFVFFRDFNTNQCTKVYHDRKRRHRIVKIGRFTAHNLLLESGPFKLTVLERERVEKSRILDLISRTDEVFSLPVCRQHFCNTLSRHLFDEFIEAPNCVDVRIHGYDQKSVCWQRGPIYEEYRPVSPRQSLILQLTRRSPKDRAVQQGAVSINLLPASFVSLHT